MLDQNRHSAGDPECNWMFVCKKQLQHPYPNPICCAFCCASRRHSPMLSSWLKSLPIPDIAISSYHEDSWVLGLCLVLNIQSCFILSQVINPTAEFQKEGLSQLLLEMLRTEPRTVSHAKCVVYCWATVSASLSSNRAKSSFDMGGFGIL